MAVNVVEQKAEEAEKLASAVTASGSVPGDRCSSLHAPSALRRSETRAALRRFFEVDAECIAIAALAQLARRDLIEPDLVEQAIHQLGVDPEKVSPMRA